MAERNVPEWATEGPSGLYLVGIVMFVILTVSVVTGESVHPFFLIPGALVVVFLGLTVYHYRRTVGE